MRKLKSVMGFARKRLMNPTKIEKISNHMKQLLQDKKG